MKKSQLYIFGFVMFCLLALTKVIALGVSVFGIITYFFGETASDAVASRMIIALLVDFVALLLMWAINKGLRIYKKPTSIISLLSPILLLAVLVLSVMMVSPEFFEHLEVFNAICWVLMVTYLILPDIFIVRDFIALRHGFPKDEADDAPPTLSQRIRNAKK